LEAHDKARQEAESANRTKDEFLSVLSHELRTPLNSMMGWIRMLRLGNLDADHTAKAIEVIDRNTRVQSSLIEDLLDVSRIISGKMRVEKELVDLVAAVKTATEGIRPIAAAKNIEFVVNASAEPLLADGDPVRLQQIVSNLVQNAIKFTSENGRIEVSITRSGGNAILEVSDTGIGIEKELQPYIFERFRQGDASTNRGFAGLGLGLTIVRTIVELHGGEITVHSDGKDRGARFTITLPLSEILYSENSNADQDDEQRLPAGELSGIKILLVDDDLDSLKSLQLFLEGQKADVAGAESAAEALKKLSEDRFDIMITDIGMPGVDGFELVAGIRSSDNGNDPNLPAIAVTAYASPGDRERAIAAGFQAHLAKPVNFDEVLSAVKRVLDPTKKALSAEH
jgi:CheY-like chemotaxis protein/two-component sensor histidine kinase